MILQEDKLVVRNLEASDADHLLRWLTDSHVLAFVEGRDRQHDADSIQETFFAEDEVRRGIIEWEGTPVGYTEMEPWDEGSKRMHGYPADASIWEMAQFIGEPSYWNQGIGTQLIQALTRYLAEQEGAQLIVMLPQIRNTRAIRCYEKCGFRRVKLLPQHQFFEGAWQNCWLMEWQPE